MLQREFHIHHTDKTAGNQKQNTIYLILVFFFSGIAINDIMLIKLENAVTYNDFAMPICFPDM